MDELPQLPIDISPFASAEAPPVLVREPTVDYVVVHRKIDKAQRMLDTLSHRYRMTFGIDVHDRR